MLNSLGNYTQTGTNFSWNFSNVTSLTEGVRSFKSAFLTPYAFYFLGLNEYGEKIADTVGVGAFAITKYYNFYKKQTTPNAFVADGVGMTFNNLPFPSYYSDKDELYVFPLTYPKYDSTTFRFSSLTNSIVPLKYSKTGYRVTKVDGWGTVVTPFGTSSCLRVITTQYGMDTIKLGPLPAFGIPNVQRSYQWLTTTSKIPFFEISGTLLAGNFTPNTARYRGYDKSLPTGFMELNAANDFSIYPNPVADKLQVFSVGKMPVVISNASGRILVSTEVLPGGHVIDVADLAPGIYFLQGHDGQSSQLRRFVKQ
jgi:hypothetical protein